MRIKFINLLLFFTSIVLGGDVSHAAHTHDHSLPIYSIIPFIGILLSIAFIPLISAKFWHNNFGKISAFWALLFLIPFFIYTSFNVAMYELLHVLVLEYIPFIMLLLSLFVISGGIRLKGTLVGTPLLNTFLIFIGTLLASWMGTTGASMLLIRPLIRANNYRKYKIHTMVFFIFLVANIGGSLTPLGDPPLFLGYLNGVDFFWTTKSLLVPMIYAVSILLTIYFLIDSYFYNKREFKTIKVLAHEKKLGIEGGFNFLLILVVIFSVLISGTWKPNISIPSIFGLHLEFQNILRDVILLLVSIVSWRFTSKIIREKNSFTWFPIVEVSKLFAGIFVTIVPAISILRSGEDGALAFIVKSVNNTNGEPINFMYFWLTGILSSFLDNAPTYLVFFNIAGSGCPENLIISDYLMNYVPDTLLAISLGAVFMGAMTYIGNAPNFMVKSIAEENYIKMPSFFGFLGWSIIILIPVFLFISFIFF